MKTSHQNLLKPLLILILGLTILSKCSGAPITTTLYDVNTAESSAASTIPAGIFTLHPQPSFHYYFGAEDEDDWYMPYRSDTHDHFSWNLLKDVLREERTANVIVSPFSVKVVLALLAEAAGNGSRTQQQLNTALADELISETENLREYYRKILPLLKRANASYTLNLETKLYLNDFIEPQQKYAAKLHAYYDTKLERLHFADANASADTINAWAGNVTAGRLQRLVTEANVRDSVLLLANVIYFKGIWRRQFNETFAGAFFRTPTEQLSVEYMQQTGQFYHYDEHSLDAKILRLPYKGGRFAMFVVLPKSDIAHANALATTLENVQYKRMQWRMERKSVKVTLPKFKFDFQRDMKQALGHLGIFDIFENNASLPGLARGADVAGRLKVSSIFQQAGIEVNERGTEAYAASAVQIGSKFGGAAQVEEFNVNRPFIFFIEEEITGNIIFAGKVLDPRV